MISDVTPYSLQGCAKEDVESLAYTIRDQCCHRSRTIYCLCCVLPQDSTSCAGGMDGPRPLSTLSIFTLLTQVCQGHGRVSYPVVLFHCHQSKI